MPRALVLLGGYGGVGRTLAPVLLRETEARLVIAGRDQTRAEAFARELHADHPGRVRSAQADALLPRSIAALLSPGDVLADLTTAWRQAPELALTALASGADFLDIHYQQASAQALAPLHETFRKAGRTLITQSGCHPGLPAAMVRAAAQRLGGLDRARLGMALRFRVESPALALELVEELAEGIGLIHEGGTWFAPKRGGLLELDLGPLFGVRPCYPMTMEELLALPQALGLRELSLRVAGFDPVTDYAVLPAIVLLGRLCSLRGRRGLARLLARVLARSINTFGRGKAAIAFCLEGEAFCNGGARRIRLVVDSDSPYGLTAWPVASCLRQHLARPLGPGLVHQGAAVDAEALLADCARLGARVQWDLPGPA